MIRRQLFAWLFAGLAAALSRAAAAKSIDLVVVEKGQRKLSLVSDGQTVRTYRVALGFDPLGSKMREGDGQTPEGLYSIDQLIFESAFHHALRISYPNAWDRRRAADAGYVAGGNIMIHGLPNGSVAEDVGHGTVDWTNGCIAVTNEEIRELVRLIPIGTPILIRK